uniref:Stearoyl-CoA desaturase n=1 Tax=Oryctolagus cuniculus TaxID=9986 RepID=A0A5F9CDJ9_RABIT
MKDDIYDPSYQDEEGPRPKLEFVWRNIILMALLHVGALYGITLVPTCKFRTWLWAFSYYVISVVGITAGAHRLWSHRTYKARLPLRLFLIIADTMAFQVRSWRCSALASPSRWPGSRMEGWAPGEEPQFQPWHFALPCFPSSADSVLKSTKHVDCSESLPKEMGDQQDTLHVQGWCCLAVCMFWSFIIKGQGASASD